MKHFLYRVILATILASVLANNTYGQVKLPTAAGSDKTLIKGKILDKASGMPLTSARFSVLAKNDSLKEITNFLVNEKGEFTFFIDNMPFYLILEPYQLSSNANILVDLSKYKGDYKGKELNVGALYLDTSHLLEEVSVTGRTQVEMTDTKRVFAVKPLTTSESPTIYNFLKGLSGITLKGADLYIDGRKKPIYYLNGSISSFEVVNSLPLDLIEKVELISSPPLLGNLSNDEGIINIILKNPERLRIGGNASSNISMSDRGNGGKLALYAANKKVFFNTTFNKYSNKYIIDRHADWRAGKELVFNEYSQNDYIVNPLFFLNTFQFKINEHFTLSAQANYSTLATSVHSSSLLEKNGASIYNLLNNKNHDNRFSLSSEFTYSHNSHSKYYFNIYSVLSKSIIDSDSRSALKNATGLADTIIALNLINNYSSNGVQVRQENSFKSGKIKFESGLLYNDYITESRANNNTNFSSYYSLRLISLSNAFKFGISKVNSTLGFRVDNNNLITGTGRPNDRSINNYWNYIPSLSFSLSDTKYGSFAITYKKGIILPSQEALNSGPVINRPNTLRVGTSNILPEQSSSYELYHLISNQKFDITSNLYYNTTRSLIGLTALKSTSTNILVSQYKNIGKLDKIGLNISFTRSFAKLSLNTGTRFELFKYRLAYLTEPSEINWEHKSYVYDISATGSYSFTKTFSSSLSFNYTNKTYTPFGESLLTSPTVSVSANKALLNRKLFVSANWSYLLNSGSTESYRYQSPIVQGQSTINSFQQNLYFSLNYTFGKTLQKLVSDGKPIVPRNTKSAE